jgi:signal transduction histidine kinase
VRKASRHLQLTDGTKEFDVLKCIESSTKLPLYREYENSITITAPKKQRVLLYGEPLRLSHILFILIRNAFESYIPSTSPEKRMVFIKLEASDDTMIIRVIDHGRGIPEETRKELFNPVRSKKKGGLGIGLFLAKEITESHFNGTLRLNKNVQHTEFILTIPIRRSK